MSEPHSQAAIDAEVARRLSAQIADDLLSVVDRYQHLDVEGPVFLRYVCLHAVAELHVTLLCDAIEQDPRRGRPWAAKILERLTLLVAPTAARPS